MTENLENKIDRRSMALISGVAVAGAALFGGVYGLVRYLSNEGNVEVVEPGQVSQAEIKEIYDNPMKFIRQNFSQDERKLYEQFYNQKNPESLAKPAQGIQEPSNRFPNHSTQESTNKEVDPRYAHIYKQIVENQLKQDHDVEVDMKNLSDSDKLLIFYQELKKAKTIKQGLNK